MRSHLISTSLLTLALVGCQEKYEMVTVALESATEFDTDPTISGTATDATDGTDGTDSAGTDSEGTGTDGGTEGTGTTASTTDGTGPGTTTTTTATSTTANPTTGESTTSEPARLRGLKREIEEGAR